MSWLHRFFNNDPAHEQKSRHAGEILRMHTKAKVLAKNSQELVDTIEHSVAYKIARARAAARKEGHD